MKLQPRLQPRLAAVVGIALVIFAGPLPAQTPAPDTIRLEVGSAHVNGLVYQPHAARVRVWTPEGVQRAEWTNVLTLGDSGGRRVQRWVTTGTQIRPAGDTVTWELRQTYDAQTLQPYGITRTTSTGLVSSLRIDGRRVHGTRRLTADGPVDTVDYEVARPGFVASASDLVPPAVGLREGLVIIAPIWGPPQTASETRVFTVLDRRDVDVEGTTVNAWRVEERRESDGRLLATWYLTTASPYMVYGEVPLPNGSVQRMTEVAVPMPRQ